MTRLSHFKFRLYVAGDALNSVQARARLLALCQEKLPERHDIEIVDVLTHPERALADSVFMTPMLVKLSPLPERRIVGTLSQTALVIQTLGLEAAQE